MQQVVVPQFLDVEDKILGPITVRQFVEVTIGMLIEVILYKVLNFPTFVVVGLLLLGFIIVLAFARINGQSFHLFLLNFVQTLKNPKLKVWRKIGAIYTAESVAGEKQLARSTLIRNPIPVSKISEIALIIDTGGIYQGENGV